MPLRLTAAPSPQNAVITARAAAVLRSLGVGAAQRESEPEHPLMLSVQTMVVDRGSAADEPGPLAADPYAQQLLGFMRAPLRERGDGAGQHGAGPGVASHPASDVEFRPPTPGRVADEHVAMAGGGSARPISDGGDEDRRSQPLPAQHEARRKQLVKQFLKAAARHSRRRHNERGAAAAAPSRWAPLRAGLGALCF